MCSSDLLTSFSHHRSTGPESAVTPWLRNPGQQDLTAHVDFTSIRNAAEAEGCTTLGFLDQMYFLLALVSANQRSERPEGHSLRTRVGDALRGVPRLETLTVKERIGAHKSEDRMAAAYFELPIDQLDARKNLTVRIEEVDGKIFEYSEHEPPAGTRK